MGAEQSNIIPMPIGFDFMTMTFRGTDQIRLTYPTEQDINTTREVIMEFWPKGVQMEMPLLGSTYGFKLKGNPFCDIPSTEDAIQSRKLAANLLFRYYNQGLKLLVSSYLTQTTYLTTWIFHRETADIIQHCFACISLSSKGSFLFIGFPSTLHQIIQTVVSQNWPKAIKRVKMIGDTLAIKLRGVPLNYENESDSIQLKSLIKEVINTLDQHNWLLYSSGNVKDAAGAMFFRHNPNADIEGQRPARFAISIGSSDRLEVIDSNPNVVDCVRSVLLQHWPRGLRNENQRLNAEVINLSGNPWWSNRLDGITARFLMCKLFEALMGIGWRVQKPIRVTRYQRDKGFYIFQECVPIFAPVFCLSLNLADRICFINAPQDVIQVVSTEIRKNWLFGIEQEGLFGISREIKLKRKPWSQSDHDGAHGRVLLCHILKVCASIGWFIILSADVSTKYTESSTKPDYPLDAHSWWFMQVPPPPQQFATAPPMGQNHIPALQSSVAGHLFPSVSVIQNNQYSVEPPQYSELFKQDDVNSCLKQE